MLKIRKDDIIQVVKGKDSGKKGKVLQVISGEGRAVVEGINFVKKHKRQVSQTQQGGIVSIEAPLAISNIMLVCKNCGRPARTGFRIAPDKKKSRYCKSCNEII